MNNRMIPPVLSAIGVIFFLAMAFDVLDRNIALFLGVVFFMLSGLSWSFVRNNDKAEI